jgi:hypothetical protein
VYAASLFHDRARAQKSDAGEQSLYDVRVAAGRGAERPHGNQYEGAA